MRLIPDVDDAWEQEKIQIQYYYDNNTTKSCEMNEWHRIKMEGNQQFF